MKICLICEGSYPFVAGGVSSWIQSMIKGMPQHEFVIWAIGANESMKGKYVYELPSNVVHVQEVFLDSMLNANRTGRKKIRLNQQQKKEIVELIRCANPNWKVIFDTFAKGNVNPIDFLLDDSFLKALKQVCREDYPTFPFLDYFWTSRSMFLPMLYLLHTDFPEADLYHSISCGYAGIIAAAAAQKFNKPYMLTEHGIYTREREEEILRSKWVDPAYKNLWIKMFYMFSRCAYDNAQTVTSLFQHASYLQRELGCDGAKQFVIPNGVNTDLFGKVPLKEPDGWVDIGAVVRIVPIKDIKTMLFAFSRVCQDVDNVRLHIIGPIEEYPEYYQECVELKEQLGLENAIFTGRVKTWEYLEKVDFTLLTSISEGMPLATLEGMAAGRAAVTTNVGCCSELIHGTGDGFGEAGFCVPAMDQKAMAEAIMKLAADPALMRKMGDAGKKRVFASFQQPDMLRKYQQAYDVTISRHAKGRGV